MKSIKGEIKMPEEKLMNNIMFQLMSFEYKIKSLFSPPEKILDEADITEGYKVVDYGCGPGRYTISLAEIVGEKGKVYAVDIHPLALKKVEKMGKRKGINNIKTLYAKDIEKIEENSIDTVILFDVLHDINNKENTLKNIEKLLKPKGKLIFKDHEMKEEEIKLLISNNTSLNFHKDKIQNNIIEFIKID